MPADWLASYIRNSTAHAGTEVEFDPREDCLVVNVQNSRDGLSVNFNTRLKVKDYIRLIANSLKRFIDTGVGIHGASRDYQELSKFLKTFLVHALPRAVASK
jgi:hypothetical protein